MSIESVMLSNHLILCRPLFLLPSIFPSIRVFSKESVLHIRWPKYWHFSFSISPSDDYSRLISFRIDLRLISLKSKRLSRVSSNTKFKRINSSALSLRHTHPYKTAGTTIALTIRTFVGKVMFLLFNHLFMFVITFKEQMSFNFTGLRCSV